MLQRAASDYLPDAEFLEKKNKMAVKVVGIERDIRKFVMILIFKSRKDLGKYFQFAF